MVNKELDNQLLGVTNVLIEKRIPMSVTDYEALKADWISIMIPGAATPRESKQLILI